MEGNCGKNFTRVTFIVREKDGLVGIWEGTKHIDVTSMTVNWVYI